MVILTFLLMVMVTFSCTVYGDNVLNGTCNMDMFHNDASAYWACRTQYSLQQNWFPSPIAGLFSYQVWNGFDGFWQNGAVLEPMVNFMAYANHTRHKSVVKNSWRNLYSLLEAYAPQPSYDDMGWYGLAYARIYEIFGWQEFLQAATDIFNWSWTNGWDATGTCSGGFWFDQTLGSKQTITNVQLLQLSAKLYRITNKSDKDLFKKMNLTWTYIVKNRLLNTTTFLLADGATVNCTANQRYEPTYNNGVFIGGLVEMHKIFNDSRYLDLAHRVANATIILKSVNGTLTEWCEFTNCNDDAKMFKGIFVRNLRYLMDVSNSKMRQKYSNFLKLNIDAVLNSTRCEVSNTSCEIVVNEEKQGHNKSNISVLRYGQKSWTFKSTKQIGAPHVGLCGVVYNSSCKIDYRDGLPYHNATGPVFGANWHGPFNYSAPMQQTSVFELFLANIQPGTPCRGDGCHYDPPTPPPRPLTCNDHPCPSLEQCCSYEGSYYTCCTPGQKCINGYCE